MAWTERLKIGLQKSSSKINEGITGIFTKRKVNSETLAELEELLITSDLGPRTAAEIVDSFSKTRLGKEITLEEIKAELAKSIAEILQPVAKKLIIDKSLKPQVILVAGVNGNGKTTTLGKLAAKFSADGNKVMLAACDTFRAAAKDQLEIWAKRNNCPLVSGPEGSDPASIAFKAIERARTEKYDVLLIDTAGRLQNKTGLMEELAKIIKVIKKIDENAPHQSLLVLDATTGQNAISQAQTFKEMININGLIITKLDGTAKGGIVVSLAKNFNLPIYGIGVGEGINDIHPFSAEDFARSLLGIL